MVSLVFSYAVLKLFCGRDELNIFGVGLMYGKLQ